MTLYRPMLFSSASVFAYLVESFRCYSPGVTSRSINAMTQVCVFPGQSSVRWSASGLRWPPARAYELCPRIGLLRHRKTRPRNWTKLTWTSDSHIWQLWYSSQNKFRLNNKRMCRRPGVLAKVRVYKTTRRHSPHDHKIEKRIGLPLNPQRRN
jgi:hypothetical protein